MFYNSDGQPVVGFPWIDDIKKVLSKSFTFSILLFLLIFFIFSPSQEEIGFNFELVKSRFDAVMKSPDKSPVKLAQYEKVHIKEWENNFVELVPLDELNNSEVFKHFINHLPIYKSDVNATTPVRRVFDASMHSKGKMSLNDRMYTGSQLTPFILEVILRLRLKEFLLTADIFKAFMRMVLHFLDRNYTCFFLQKKLARSKF